MEGVEDKGGDVAGYMPLQRQVGFIYDNPNLFIIAHELGHGAFNLRHTFSPESFIAAERTTQNLMDYPSTGVTVSLSNSSGQAGTELWKHQWEFIHDPQSVWFAWAQDESEGAYGALGVYTEAYIKNIRCKRYRGENNYYDETFKYVNGEYNYDAWSHPDLLNDEKYGNIWVWYTCNKSEAIDVSKISRLGSYVYVGNENGCRLKFLVRDGNYNESDDLAQSFLEYLTVSSSGYNTQFNKYIAELSRSSSEKIMNEILNMSSCTMEKLSAEWRLFFFEKIITQDDVISESEAVCINRILSTVKDEGQASTLIASIKEKGYERKMIKSITNMRSTVFSNIANGLSWLYYSQNKNTVLEAGKNVAAENFYAWEPYGNVKEKYEAVASNPSFSTFFDWMYNSRTYTYTVHLEDDGRFRVHAIGTEFSHLGPATYQYDFYISPFETVSVYLASKNKYINIEDYTVVMPGVLFAWVIDQGEREANQMMINIGATAVSFYLGGAAIVKATGTAGKIINTILFAKGLADIMLSSPEVLNILVKKKGDKGDVFITKYKDLSKIIDCGLIFKDFADKEISSKISLLITAWGEVDESIKDELKKNKPEVFNYVQEEINKLSN